MQSNTTPELSSPCRALWGFFCRCIEAYYNLANVFLAKRQFTQSLTMFDEALEVAAHSRVEPSTHPLDFDASDIDFTHDKTEEDISKLGLGRRSPLSRQQKNEKAINATMVAVETILGDNNSNQESVAIVCSVLNNRAICKVHLDRKREALQDLLLIPPSLHQLFPSSSFNIALLQYEIGCICLCVLLDVLCV
eukprot:m.162699 g.162699  ORF g.162699 m.162699 type:complete len:193 (+) comp13409_c0_seq5:2-580(+)